jgi:hypothetical protein
MTTPTITLYPDTLPAKGQSNAPFDVNVDDFMTWLTATNGPELAAMITWTQGVADTVLATALAGNLPALTGKALNFIRANAAEDGGEFRTPAQVLSDILAAPLASPDLTGNPTAPTQTAGNDSTRIATTAFLTAAIIAARPAVGEVSSSAKVARYSSVQHNIGDTVSGSLLFTYETYSSSDEEGSSFGGAFSAETIAATGLSGTWQWESAGSRTGTITRAGSALRIS